MAPNLQDVARLVSGEPLLANMATCVDDRPHVAPVWYRYVDGRLDVLTSGKKLDNVERNPLVAVSIQRSDRGQARWMVSLRGTATVVEDPARTAEAASAIDAKYGDEATATDRDPEEIANTLVEIDIGSASIKEY